LKLTVQKSQLQGQVKIPPSKSHTIRAVAIGSLANGLSTIRNPLNSSDTLSAVNCYNALGAKIDTSDPNLWKIAGNAGKPSRPENIIDVGNSGTTLRIAIGSASLAETEQTINFTGDKQIQTRPLGPLMNALENLGAKCSSQNKNGRVPVKISGKLKGGHTTIEAKTSQFLSSLLLCAPLAENDTEIDVTVLNEPGYVQMTLDWLDKQNIKYQNDNFKKFKITGSQSYIPFEAAIPADFSSATFFLCAAALAADNQVTLTGLDLNDSQPDKAVIEYLKQMGANIKTESNTITIKKSELKGACLDMNQTPDALPAMAVTAAFAKGTTKLINVEQARSKETDRIKTMAQELTKLSINLEELPDGLVIHGPLYGSRDTGHGAQGRDLNGHSDHRIVMALAVAGLMLSGKTSISTAEAINVTFPQFTKLMTALGAKIQTIKS